MGVYRSQPEVSRPAPLGERVLVGYATGGAVAGAYATVVGLMMLPYLTDTLGIGPAAAGILLLMGRLFDVAMSPLAGRLSDRTHSAIGARRPYLALGGPLLAIALAAAFSSPGTGAAGYVYVLVALLAAGTAFALFQVPYAGMPAEITDSETERTQLMTRRMAALGAASLLAGGVAPLVVDAAGGGPSGYRWMGVMVGALIAVSALAAFVGTARAPLGRPYPSEASLRRQIAAARQSPAFRALLVCFVVQSIAIGSLLVGARYVSTLVWRDPAATSPLFVAFIGPAVLVMAPWSLVGRRLGKLTAYRLGSLILAGASAVLVALPLLPRALVYAVVVVAGVGYAGLQVFAQALLPDYVADDTARTGRRQAGVFTGLWTAGQSLGMGAGALLFALLLQVAGYRPSTSDGTATTVSIQFAVLIGFATIPSLLVAAALIFLRGRVSVERR
jgi:Na+/melibiose symporter-like transporter